MSRCIAYALSMALVGLLLVGRAACEEAAPIEIKLHPAAAPQPALRYRLLPDFSKRINGNAAVYYGKVKSEKTPFFANKEIRDNIKRWTEAPLDQIRRERAEISFNRYYLEQAARCAMCDWQLPIGREPYAYILLPEAQEMRHFSRILAVQARVEMAMGDYETAIDICQLKFAMGRHVADAPTFVNALIGVAICEQTIADLRELVQVPDAPNLYWALSSLPQPLIDFRPGLEVERRFVNLTLQDRVDVDAASLSTEQWRQRLADVVTEIQKFAEDADRPMVAVDLDEALPRLTPIARQALLDSGRSKESVDAMADAQAVLADWLDRYYRHADDCYCAWPQEYQAAMASFDAIDARAQEAWQQRRDPLPLDRLTPGFRATRRALARLERSLAVMRVLEALRIHAAAHDGKLPKKLADVIEVPLPTDPVSGQAFEYELRDGVASLRGPSLPDAPLNYEITIATAAESDR